MSDSAQKIILSNHNTGANMPANIGQSVVEAVHKANLGRMSSFTPEKALEILEHLMEGGTVRSYCEKSGHRQSTVYTWAALVPDFKEQIAQARRIGAACMVDEGVAALDSVVIDPENHKPALAELRKAEQRARFRLDLAKCYDFQTYGDKRQSLNINANVDVPLVDLSRWMNGGYDNDR